MNKRHSSSLYPCWTFCFWGKACNGTVRVLACEILNLYYDGKVDLMGVTLRGIVDGADALSNIIDTCNGLEALRSRFVIRFVINELANEVIDQ